MAQPDPGTPRVESRRVEDLTALKPTTTATDANAMSSLARSRERTPLTAHNGHVQRGRARRIQVERCGDLWPPVRGRPSFQTQQGRASAHLATPASERRARTSGGPALDWPHYPPRQYSPRGLYVRPRRPDVTLASLRAFIKKAFRNWQSKVLQEFGPEKRESRPNHIQL
jgi:hypothetical protein